jgi:hypothetical protein
LLVEYGFHAVEIAWLRSTGVGRRRSGGLSPTAAEVLVVLVSWVRFFCVLFAGVSGPAARALLGLRNVVKTSVPDDFSTATADELAELRRLAATDPRLAAAVEMTTSLATPRPVLASASVMALKLRPRLVLPLHLQVGLFGIRLTWRSPIAPCQGGTLRPSAGRSRDGPLDAV